MSATPIPAYSDTFLRALSHAVYGEFRGEALLQGKSVLEWPARWHGTLMTGDRYATQRWFLARRYGMPPATIVAHFWKD